MSHVSIWRRRLEALVEIRKIECMKNQTQDSELKNWKETLQDTDISLNNWGMKIKWFEPFMPDELDMARSCSETYTVSAQLADVLNFKADEDIERLKLETEDAKLSWETVTKKDLKDECSSSCVERCRQ